MTKKGKYELVVINSLDEIPDFATEDEEREWWATHEFSNELWETLEDKSGELAAELDEIIPLPSGPRRRIKARP